MSKVAVVIPAFNRVAMLSRAIESVFRQTKAPAELIIVDDGSEEDLAEPRRRIEERGFKWISLERNEGVAAARNAGVAATSSEWISFLDSDDLWNTAKLERQLAWHRLNPEVRISQTREEWVRNGAPVPKPTHWEPGEGQLKKASRRRCMIGPSCVMIRRDLWEETGGFDRRFRVCEDFELWLRVTASNPVGLVGGLPLVTKFAGHSDQLSITTPALDRHRIVALLEFLGSAELSDIDRADVTQVIREKAAIVAQGAAKRGERERESFYHTFQHADLTGSYDSLDPLLSAAWRMAS